MRKMLLFFAFSLLSISVYSQDVFLNFSTSPQQCPYDSTQTVTMYDDWEVYTTLDGTWNGVRDSSFCANISSVINNYLDLSSLVEGETVFLRHKFEDSTKILLGENTLYSSAVSTYFPWDSTNFTNNSNNCANGICTGTILGIDIPGDTTTRAMRWYQSAPDQITNHNFNIHFCTPTEYFEANNYLREAIIKLTVNSNGGGYFRPYAYCLVNSQFWWINDIQDSLIVPYWNWDSTYRHHFYDVNIGLFGDTSLYPKLTNMQYIDLLPTPNVDSVVTMDLIIDSYSSFIMQPYTQLRGGYVLNDSIQRHNYNLINNGGNLCFAMIIDKVFTGGDNYIHNDGTVEFNGQMSCFEFGEQSALIVGDNATLYYGENGMGNLALRSRGTIKIGQDAELIINNNVILYEFSYDNKAQQIYIDLNPGSKLTFSSNARISNHQSYDGTMKLNIRMKGGTIDLSELDADSRQLINLIYEDKEVIYADNIKLLGNPVANTIRFYINNENDNQLNIKLISTNGQVVMNKTKMTTQGVNYVDLDVLEVPNGLYFLNIQSNEGNLMEKVLIIR